MSKKELNENYEMARGNEIKNIRCNNAKTFSMLSTYNQNSKIQAYTASLLDPFLRRAAAELDSILPPGTPLEICEYGCATGGSSIAPIRAIHETVGNRSLHVTLNDLPSNDWSVLQETVEPEFPSIQFKYEMRSMYTPVGTTHLAYSCYALHWLNQGAPSGLSNGALWANQLPRDHTDRVAWENASQQDWETLLRVHAEEIPTGGFMVLHIQSSQCSGDLQEEYAKILQQVKLTMMAEEELSEQEARSMIIPEFLKSPLDILRLLERGSCMTLWEVEEMIYRRLPCKYVEDMNKATPSRNEEIVENQIRYLRAFTDSSLYASIGEKKTEYFWSLVRRMVDGNPEKLDSRSMATFIVLRRR